MAAAGITNCQCLKQIGNNEQKIWNKGVEVDQGFSDPCSLIEKRGSSTISKKRIGDAMNTVQRCRQATKTAAYPSQSERQDMILT